MLRIIISVWMISSICCEPTYTLKYVHTIFDKGQTIPAHFHQASINKDSWRPKSIYRTGSEPIEGTITFKAVNTMNTFAVLFQIKYDGLVPKDSPPSWFKFRHINGPTYQSSVSKIGDTYQIQTPVITAVSAKDLDADYSCDKRDRLIEMARAGSTTKKEQEEFDMFIQKLKDMTGENVTASNHLNYIKDLKVEETEFKTQEIIDFFNENKDIILKSFKCSMGLFDNRIKMNDIVVDEELRKSRIQSLIWFNYLELKSIANCIISKDCDGVADLKLGAYAANEMTINSFMMGLGIMDHMTQLADFLPKAGSNLIIEMYDNSDNSDAFFKVILSRNGMSGNEEVTKKIKGCEASEYCNWKVFTTIAQENKELFNCVISNKSYEIPIVVETTPMIVSTTTRGARIESQTETSWAPIVLCVVLLVIVLILVGLLVRCWYQQHKQKKTEDKIAEKQLTKEEWLIKTADQGVKYHMDFHKNWKNPNKSKSKPNFVTLNMLGHKNKKTNAYTIGGMENQQQFYLSSGPQNNQDECHKFWAMICQEKIHTIVICGPTIQRGVKCFEQYWPMEVGGVLKFGVGTNTIMVRKIDPVVRTFCDNDVESLRVELTYSGLPKPHIVVIHQWVAWLSDSVPPLNSMARCTLLRIFETPEPPQNNRILVQCPDGSGQAEILVRTNLLKQSLENGNPDVNNLLTSHLQQQKAIGTPLQYVYALGCVLYYGFMHTLPLTENDLLDNWEYLLKEEYTKPYLDCYNALIDVPFETRLALFATCPPNKSTSFVTGRDRCNRRKDIKCLNLNRVKVRYAGAPHDYYNANYAGHISQPRLFISAQTPMKKEDLLDEDGTTYSFWAMHLQENAEFSLMIGVVQDGDHQYWPLKQGKLLSFGNQNNRQIIDVLTQDVEHINEKLVQFSLKVTKGKETPQNITLYQWKWEDHDAPDSDDTLFKLLKIITNTSSPIVVACSDGVGQNGVVIGLWMLMQNARQGVFRDVLPDVRCQRNMSISTKMQYAYMYAMFLEFLKSMIMSEDEPSIKEVDWRDAYFQLHAMCKEAYVNRRTIAIDKWSEKILNDGVEAVKKTYANFIGARKPDVKVFSKNDRKNRFEKYKCCEKYRVKSHGSLYYNACYYGNRANPKRFILAQGPQSDKMPLEGNGIGVSTVHSYLSMLIKENVNLVVMFGPWKENGYEASSEYIPEVGRSKTFKSTRDDKSDIPAITVTTRGVLDGGKWMKTYLKLDGAQDGEKRIIHYHWKEWGWKDYRLSLSPVFSLLASVTKDTNPVVLQCYTGASQSATSACIWVLKESMSSGEPIMDILSDVRNHRTWSITSVEQYLMLHITLLDYFNDEPTIWLDQQKLYSFRQEVRHILEGNQN